MSEKEVLIKAANDLSWIKKIGYVFVLLTMSMIGTAVLAISNSGKLTERVNNHIEIEKMQHSRVDQDIEKLNRVIKSTQDTLIEHMILDTPATLRKLSSKKKEWEKTREIYCIIDGEEA